MRRKFQKTASLLFLLGCLTLLVACGGTSKVQTRKAPVASTTPAAAARGEQLLAQSAQLLNTARTLDGIFQGTISGQLASGKIQLEVWRLAPDKSRTLVLQSTLSQFTADSLTVDNGKQVWQYDPAKKLVYTGSASSTSGTSTPGGSQGGNLSQLLFGIVQAIFNQSDATLISSSDQINGHSVYTLQVSPQSQAVGNGLGISYTGTVSIDQHTSLPLALNLTLQGFGQVHLTIPTLILNGTLSAKLFTFTPPPGTKVLPLQASNSTTSGGSLTLQQAEQQAGYHLLSIPTSQTAYQLQSIDALGAPGSQIYTFNYSSGGQSFTLSQGRSLAHLPVSGQMMSLRGTSATLSNSGATYTLSWTERSVGIQITGLASKAQILTIARMLV